MFWFSKFPVHFQTIDLKLFLLLSLKKNFVRYCFFYFIFRFFDFIQFSIFYILLCASCILYFLFSFKNKSSSFFFFCLLFQHFAISFWIILFESFLCGFYFPASVRLWLCTRNFSFFSIFMGIVYRLFFLFFSVNWIILTSPISLSISYILHFYG